MFGAENIANDGQLLLGIFTDRDVYTSIGSTAGVARSGSRYLSTISSTLGFRLGLSNAATRIAGFGYRANTAVGGTAPIFAFCDNGSPHTAANVQVSLAHNANGSLAVYRGRNISSTSAGTLLGTSAASVIAAANVWYYIELVVTFSATVGTVDVFVDNVSVLSLTGLNTITTANAYANGFGIAGSAFSGITTLFDDLYVLSGSGGVRTTRIGPCRVICVLASSGDGSVAQFTPSTGSDNGAMVDETTPDDDTTYNKSLTTGFIDTYNFPALGISGDVKGLQIRNYGRSESGTATARAVQRISGVNYFNTATPGISTSYHFLPPRISEQSPATAADYTVAEIDAAEFGIEHTS